ncbi:MAG: acyl-CoA/acyl-ACP dehydrogenase [Rhodospirillaceae bacterium]|nr:acyl-CoA/acyl-ACP dehydrogenase [Rhodospirillaceae bacterium]
MNFDFSDDQKLLRDQAQRFLRERCPPSRVRHVLEGAAPFDVALWQGLAELGYLGVAIPAEHGGAGAGYVELCLVAEALGRVLAPVPSVSSLYLAAECLMIAGSPAQKALLLPAIASGNRRVCVAVAAGRDRFERLAAGLAFEGGRLDGAVPVVLGGDSADFAIVAARDGGSISLFLADLAAAGVARTPLATLDPSRGHARLDFAGAAAERLGAAGEAWPILSRVLDRAAVLVAFEQLGGAERALELARDYALERHAFARPIGSFQAIKHMLADMYVSATLARANCLYGAWALAADVAELPLAASTAHVSAGQAFRHCARNLIQVHGAMGFAWEADCHLYYRRAHLLSLALGGPLYWEDRLVAALDIAKAA